MVEHLATALSDAYCHTCFHCTCHPRLPTRRRHSANDHVVGAAVVFSFFVFFAGSTGAMW